MIKYLVEHEANVAQSDNDGWTALHNASSRGFLNIVRFLIENGGADPNVLSKLGYTPLMNAASKGHLPIVHYLVKGASANPLLKNNFGESAYDGAAAVFEVYICEVLERFEAEWWRKMQSSQPYNTISIHTTVPVLLHENQRATVNVTSLIRGSSPKFSAQALHPLRDTRGAWSRPDGRTMTKEEVHLPDGRDSLASSTASLRSSPAASQKAWFWLSDWQVDTTHPRVDAAEGWQYARSFEDAEEAWVPDAPTQGNNWVRRRRWVRIMKRRLDVPSESTREDSTITEEDPQWQATLQRATDYIERAQYIVGKQDEEATSPTTSRRKQNRHNEQRREIRRFEGALAILREGIDADQDESRREQAETLADAWKEHINTLKDTSPHLSDVEEEVEADEAGDNSLENAGEEDADEDGSAFVYRPEEEDEAEAFVYPASSSNGHATSPTPTTPMIDITAALSSAPTFAYPTHDAPSRPAAASAQSIRAINQPEWEDDSSVNECRRCNRKFSLWVRRHHCRRCGKVVCDKCSTNRALLHPSQVVTDPTTPESWIITAAGATLYHRVCDVCFATLGRPASRTASINSRTGELNASLSSLTNLTAPPFTRRTSSASMSSTMMECPVCGLVLSTLSAEEMREDHVQACLEGRGPQGALGPSGIGRYLVYKLPEDSPLVHQECVICFESFLPGQGIARLDCLCSYHVQCIRAWFARGKECPVHQVERT